MAARKIKAPKTSSSETRAFVVVLEEMRSHFKVFGEGHQLLREQQEMLRQEMTVGLAAVRQEMTVGFGAVRREMTAGLAAVRQEMTAGFAAVRQEMTADFAAVRQDMATGFERVENDVAELRQDVGLVRVALEKKVDRDEVEGIVARVVARGR